MILLYLALLLLIFKKNRIFPNLFSAIISLLFYYLSICSFTFKIIFIVIIFLLFKSVSEIQIPSYQSRFLYINFLISVLYNLCMITNHCKNWNLILVSPLIFFILNYYLTTLLYYFSSFSVPNKIKVLIVLGCRLDKLGNPTPNLINRLDKLLNVLKTNKKIEKVILSGGAAHTDKAECDGMLEYILKNQKNISVTMLLERNSTNTIQNFKYSYKLIEDEKIDLNNCTFLTTDYHIYRAVLYNQSFGNYQNPIVSKSNLIQFLPKSLHEIASIMIYFLNDYFSFFIILTLLNIIIFALKLYYHF